MNPSPTPGRPSRLIAQAAHELWRERMLDEGWRPGGAFNAALQTHDALVPFDELSEELQHDAEYEAIASGAMDLLQSRELHPRGEHAPLLPSTVLAGQRVTFVSGPPTEGVVIGCSVEPLHGTPEMVHVHWDDGTDSSHPLAAGELRLARPRKHLR